MTLRSCMQKAELEDAIQKGLQALGNESHRIRCRNPRDLSGSVDLDTAFKETEPNAPRWDYCIGKAEGAQTEKIHWVEIHPAHSGEVNVLQKKIQWLKAKLRIWGCQSEAKNIHWVSSNGVHLDMKHQRKCAQLGIPLPRRNLQL